jgi:hypothetical protein
MSWARSAVLMCLATMLAGCSGSSGSGSSSEPHGLLPAGRVYHAIVADTELSSGGHETYTDDEWVDVDTGRFRVVQGNGAYQTVTVFNGKTGLSRTRDTSSTHFPSSGALWHVLASSPLPQRFYSSPVRSMVEAAVRGDHTVFGQPLHIVKSGNEYVLRVDDPAHDDIVVRVVGSVTPAQADGRQLFTFSAPHPQQIVTQLAPGTRPDSGAAYWLGPTWGHQKAAFAQTALYRRTRQPDYTVQYGATAFNPWDVGSQIGQLTVTTGAMLLPGFHPRGNKTFFIRPVGGKKVTLADGTQGVLLSDEISWVTVSNDGDQVQVPDVNSFSLWTHGVEVQVFGTFPDKDIERIAGALRPV